MSETTPTTAKRGRKPKATEMVAETTAVESVAVAEATEEAAENVITVPQKAHTDGPVRSNTNVTATGVIGSVAADRVMEKPATPEPKPESTNKVALWSDKNIRWSGVGTLSKGYNIVNKEAAAKWLVKEGIREATPEEVATYYGK